MRCARASGRIAGAFSNVPPRRLRCAPPESVARAECVSKPPDGDQGGGPALTGHPKGPSERHLDLGPEQPAVYPRDVPRGGLAAAGGVAALVEADVGRPLDQLAVEE